MFKRLFFLILYFLSPLVLTIAIFSSNVTRYSNFKLFVPMLLGTISYTWLIFEFVLSARPKFIERYFGLDKFYRFHGLIAIISVILVFIHKTLFTGLMGEFSTSEMGDKAWISFLIVVILALVFMTDLVVKYFKPLFKFRKLLEKIKIAKYEYQVAIHNISIIGLILMFIHVMMTYGAKTNLLIRAIFILYFLIGITFYLYHKVVRIFILKKNIFIIKELIKESENMYTLNLTPENGRIFSYKPGQFGFIRILGKNVNPEEHPFSFSSAPTNKEYISVTIKEIGDFTSSIKNSESGYKVYLDAPYGTFSYLNYKDEEGIVLISGGVGITPALSMLRYIYKNDRSKKAVLIWGINNQNEIINREELGRMQKELKNFKFVPVVYKEDDSWTGEKGIINIDIIQRALEKHDINIYKQGYYICGPSIMLNTVLKALKDMGIKRKYIHYEKFSL